MLLGLQYGGVPSINTLQSIYNFQVGEILILQISGTNFNEFAGSLNGLLQVQI